MAKIKCKMLETNSFGHLKTAVHLHFLSIGLYSTLSFTVNINIYG